MKKAIIIMILGLFCLSFAIGCQSVTGRSAGETIDDSTITTEINAKIVKDKELSYFKINVDTFQGNVTLTGAVKSKEAEGRLIDIARSVRGVKSVKSNVLIQTK